MSDNFENENKQAQEIRDSLAPLESREPLPESLSKENIEALITNTSEKPADTHVKKTAVIRRFAALAAAAAVFTLCCVGFAGMLSGRVVSKDVAPAAPTLAANEIIDDNNKISPTESGTQSAAPANASDYDYVMTVIKNSPSRYAFSEGLATTVTDNGSSVEYAPMAPGATQGSTAPNMSPSYGKTNVQVDGIDEADVIKTDGEYIYIAYADYKDGLCDTNKIAVVDSNTKNFRIVSEITFPDEKENVIDFYLRENTLIAITSIYNSEKTTTGYRIFDITDKTKPSELDSFSQDGCYISSRINGGNLILISSKGLYTFYAMSYSTGSAYTVTNDAVAVSPSSSGSESSGLSTPPAPPAVSTPPVSSASSAAGAPKAFVSSATAPSSPADAELAPKDVIPMTYSGNESGIMIPADRIYITDEKNPNVFTVVTSTPLDNLSAVPAAESILGSSNQIYCSKDRLYVFGDSYETLTEKTETAAGDNTAADNSAVSSSASITNFTKISVFDISKGSVSFIGTCKAPGYCLSNFSADEYNGYFRIATCENLKSYITVFDSQLKETGRTEAFGIGESIQSARFMGDTAYVVTFLQTDPLFVIDLSDPAKPVLVGELKIPGFSSYLHPAGENLVIGIGTGGDENGADNSAKISLFDVSDPKKPVEISNLIIDSAYFNTQPRAFVSIDDGSFMVPFTQEEFSVSEVATSYSSHEGLLRFKVEDGKIVKLNEYRNSDNDEHWYGIRGTYIGNTVYSARIWDLNITAYSMETGEKLGSVS